VHYRSPPATPATSQGIITGVLQNFNDKPKRATREEQCTGEARQTQSRLRDGWHRQAQLGDGGFGVRKTIAKAFGLDDATRRRRGMTPPMSPFSGLCDRPDGRSRRRLWERSHQGHGLADAGHAKDRVVAEPPIPVDPLQR